ncbi:MAG: YifB family Mg chelatase-like AAA ATPase [Christensenellales bacterium]|jgi:magnesium chelatase family protein
MLSAVHSYGLDGIDGFALEVQVDVSNGLPDFTIVGLPGQMVKESKNRVRAAIENSGLAFPMQRITINLSPADKRKEGTVYDLPIAIGILCATGQVRKDALQDLIVIGELALNGALQSVTGVLPMVISAAGGGMRRMLLPSQNAQEAACIEGMEIFGVCSLAQTVDHLNQKRSLRPTPMLLWDTAAAGQHASLNDFSQIKGQQHAKRALEIAVAGGHNVAFSGPPGAGKTMLARSIPSIMPPLTFEEALEVTKIHSVAGKLENGALVKTRPFCAPHHSISTPALIGGSKNAVPGEISLAHLGVLFLDELPEFKRDSLEALRQPIEDGFVSVNRVNASYTYPSRFMLVASMNPCRCGNFGSRTKTCHCTPTQIRNYAGRISRALMDRIDLFVVVAEVTYEQITGKQQEEPSECVRRRITAARTLQHARYEGARIYFNAQLNNPLMKRYCRMEPSAQRLLQTAFENLQLSARGYSRVIKVSKTIADLQGSETILEQHIAEAIQYRSLDR